MEYVLHFIKSYIKWTVIIWAVLFTVSAMASETDEPAVKKSESGICHAMDSRYYKRTKNFVAFETLDSCLETGGRLPKNYVASN